MCLTVDLVKRCGRLILCLGIVAGLLGLAGQDCLAKVKVDRYFVDAQNNTGYYIDVNSIEVVSDHEILVDMYLVKCRERYMYAYRTRFNTEELSYQYLNTRIYNYETKKLSAKSQKPLPELTYKKSQILQEVLAFTQQWKATHIKKTQYGEIWE